MAKLLFAAALIACCALVAADLPVHCIRSDVLGKWTLHHSEQKFDNTVDCANFDKAGELEVDLALPDKVTDSNGNTGFWTMIYDEGMEIRINGNRYFSFFEYKKPDYSTSSLHRSFCGMTLRKQGGSFHDDNKKAWGCFRGVRHGKKASAVTYLSEDGKKNWMSCAKTTSKECHSKLEENELEEVDNMNKDTAAASGSNDDDVDVSKSPVSDDIDDEDDDFDDDINLDDVDEEMRKDILSINGDRDISAREPELSDLDKLSFDLELEANEPRPERVESFEADHDLVELINNSQDSYTAAVYPQFVGKKLSDIQKMAGGKSFRQVQTEHEEHFGVSNLQTMEYDENFDEGLPESWDWRNVNGENYLFEPINQGMCGSCFAVATTDMIQTRARIATKNKLKRRLAIQDILSCGNRYAQGCHGGFPFLASKFAEDYGLTSQSCMSYRAETAPEACAKNKACYLRDKVYAKNYHYIGGYYGGCSAREMMKEIMANGPIAIGFQVNSGVMHYKSGVFLDVGDVDQHAKNFFEPTNHAVLAVGWGVDDKGNKYWTVKNSWGPEWGEGGYFRIQRGRDTAHFESMAVAAEVVVPKEFM